MCTLLVTLFVLKLYVIRQFSGRCNWECVIRQFRGHGYWEYVIRQFGVHGNRECMIRQLRGTAIWSM